MHLTIEDPKAYLYDVIDLNTKHKIHLVQEANDKTGEFSMHLYDDKGDLICSPVDREAILFRFKGNIKLVKKEKTNAKRKTQKS